MPRRLPAEWEEQSGVLLAWPHEGSDWLLHLDIIEPVFISIIREISRFEPVLLVTTEPERVGDLLNAAGVSLERVRICQIESNDTWARDFGPITVLDEGRPRLLDFGFNGWGLKFAADLDNRITRRLHASGVFCNTPLTTIGLVLEGGSIESDGDGTILTTAQCILNDNRNPHLNRRDLEEKLADLLGADHFLWLENGSLEGDDTDSHVDTVARLCPDNTIVYQACDDSSDRHYQTLSNMAGELERFTVRSGAPCRLIPLPWPSPRYDEAGYRLPATYANFLIINGAVLVPTYRDKNDVVAIAAIGRAFPGREIIGVNSLPLLLQHGSLHCLTMQLPKGVLA